MLCDPHPHSHSTVGEVVVLCGWHVHPSLAPLASPVQAPSWVVVLLVPLVPHGSLKPPVSCRLWWAGRHVLGTQKSRQQPCLRRTSASARCLAELLGPAFLRRGCSKGGQPVGLWLCAKLLLWRLGTTKQQRETAVGRRLVSSIGWLMNSVHHKLCVLSPSPPSAGQLQESLSSEQALDAARWGAAAHTGRCTWAVWL